MRVRLDFPFAGVLLIIAHLVGKTLTNDAVGLGVNLLTSSGISVLVPVMAILQFSSPVQCTTTATEMRAFAPQQQDNKHEVGPEEQLRRPRLIKELTMMNRQSCMAKILCGVEVAKPPSSSSSTVNDFSYLVKAFFDIFSLDGGNKKKSGDQDDEDAESDESKEEDDVKPYRSSSRRKNSKKPYLSGVKGESDVDLVDSYNNDLETLLNESDNFLFKKRTGLQRGLQHAGNNTSKNVTQNYRAGRIGKLFTRRAGFMGYSNPRFDKTAFLNKKQLQMKQATTEQEKLQIAGEVANKLQSPRQCRLLSWLRPPSYTTTTTITTTSNDPSVAQIRNEEAVNTMCPFTTQELQTMIVSTQGNVKIAPSGGGQVVGGASLGPSQSLTQQSRPTPAPYQVHPKKNEMKPLTLTAYGETDPDLELMKDPFYALVPPEPSPTQQQPQFQTFGFNQPTKYPTQQYQQFNPAQFHLGNQRPSNLQQTLEYFRTTERPQITTTEQQGSKYSKYFYLNSDEPRPTHIPTVSPPKTTKLPPTTPKTTPKPKAVNSEEDDEEDDDEKNDSGEENDNSNSDISEIPENHPSHGQPPRPMNQNVGGYSGQGQNSEKLLFRIPSKIHVSLPSFRGLATKFRNQNVRPKPQSQRVLDPIDANSDESPEHGRHEPRNRKRQTNLSHEKQLVFKTNLEYQERVKDQHSPPFIMSRTPPAPARLPPPPPLPPKSQQKAQNEDKDSEEDDQEGEDDEEDDDDEEEERSGISQPKTPSKKQPAKPITPKKTSLLKVNENSKKNSTGVLRHFLSDHGMRTLSTITDMFYGSQQEEEVHPHDDVSEGGPPPGPPPPPPRRKNGPRPPKRRRRPPPPYRRRKPGPRPQQDQQGDDSEEEDEDDDSDEKKQVTTKKPTPTVPPQPLHPVVIPPRVVAIPIFLEGKEEWDGVEKPHEEEFFEPKPKKKANNKPEKYDYDYADSVESINSSEGIDFGPGQKIQTEYSDIVDNVKRPGVQHPHNDRFVHGLPTTWEDMFEELKRQKQIEKWKKKQIQKNNKKKNVSGSDEESEEDEEDSPGRRPHQPGQNSNYRPPPPHFNREPID